MHVLILHVEIPIYSDSMEFTLLGESEVGALIVTSPSCIIVWATQSLQLQLERRYYLIASGAV